MGTCLTFWPSRSGHRYGSYRASRRTSGTWRRLREGNVATRERERSDASCRRAARLGGVRGRRSAARFEGPPATGPMPGWHASRRIAAGHCPWLAPGGRGPGPPGARYRRVANSPAGRIVCNGHLLYGCAGEKSRVRNASSACARGRACDRGTVAPVHVHRSVRHPSRSAPSGRVAAPQVTTTLYTDDYCIVASRAYNHR